MKKTFDPTELEKLASDVDPTILKDFLDRMDPDYFPQFPPRTIAKHLGLANALTPERPCALSVEPETREGLYLLTVVAYDYFAEFAAMCGVLSAYGFDIREALVFTYLDDPAPSSASSASKSLSRRQALKWPVRRHSQRPGLSRKKVVDVFQVHLLPGTVFNADVEQALGRELTDMIRLLEARNIQDVRNYVNRKLVETLGRRHATASVPVQPAEILFNNALSARETVMDIRGMDSPAFLYAFTNALAMREIYLSKATIEGDGLNVNNRLFVRDRYGRKIVSTREQQELALAAAFIKEFTHHLTWAPNPGRALNHLGHFLDRLLEHRLSRTQINRLTGKHSLVNLARLFGTSDFLWEDLLRRQQVNLLPIIETLQEPRLRSSKTDLAKALNAELGTRKDPAIRKELLNQFKDEELFRINIHHLLNKTSLPAFSDALTTLAEVILAQALVEAQAVVNRRHAPPAALKKTPLPVSICGLGKLGGRELGYASDIEILFVYGTAPGRSGTPNPVIGEYHERLIQEFLHWIEAKEEGMFHIDLRLRPYGEKGLLANSFDEITSYYRTDGAAAPFERQAWIKLRHLAGNAALGRRIERYRDDFVYSPTPWSLDTALHLRRRQMQELVPGGAIHVKYGPGGIIDVEYAVQYLQVQHGHREPSLRTPNTLQGIKALQETRLLSRQDATILTEDYLFMRKVIDGLRIVRGNAKDLVLPESGSDNMMYLARRLGYITGVWQEGARAFERELQQRMSRSHAIFTRLFHPGGRKRKKTTKRK